MSQVLAPVRLELGCGNKKEPGLFGIDRFPGPGIDLALNFEHEVLPFPDHSIEYIFSSHALEHVEPSRLYWVLREIFRVCQDGAMLEFWTPYAGADEAFMPGHCLFFSEALWGQICQNDGTHFLGPVVGGFEWLDLRYNLVPGVLEFLEASKVSLHAALRLWRNIAWEFGVVLRVNKVVRPTLTAPSVRHYGYSRHDMKRLP